MKAKEIKELIDFIAKSGLEEVKLETEEIKLNIKKQALAPVNMVSSPLPQTIAQPIVQAAPAAPVEAASTPAPEADNSKSSSADESNYITVKSPMIGTFYRSSGPDKDAFVSVGDSVSEGTTVCIIEAMKLFNEIESEVSGKVVKILVDNATPVEYDQPLFLVDPS